MRKITLTSILITSYLCYNGLAQEVQRIDDDDSNAHSKLYDWVPDNFKLLSDDDECLKHPDCNSLDAKIDTAAVAKCIETLKKENKCTKPIRYQFSLTTNETTSYIQSDIGIAAFFGMVDWNAPRALTITENVFYGVPVHIKTVIAKGGVAGHLYDLQKIDRGMVRELGTGTATATELTIELSNRVPFKKPTLYGLIGPEKYPRFTRFELHIVSGNVRIADGQILPDSKGDTWAQSNFKLWNHDECLKHPDCNSLAAAINPAAVTKCIETLEKENKCTTPIGYQFSLTLMGRTDNVQIGNEIAALFEIADTTGETDLVTEDVFLGVPALIKTVTVKGGRAGNVYDLFEMQRQPFHWDKGQKLGTGTATATGLTIDLSNKAPFNKAVAYGLFGSEAHLDVTGVELDIVSYAVKLVDLVKLKGWMDYSENLGAAENPNDKGGSSLLSASVVGVLGAVILFA